ncbi:hypothetical protein BC833DRAFT_590425 [Globomyces pollinis-pini]|nr:hypothetical protein BC833DRAFT_590425 [Globomyces pollinis-pini]
MSCVDYFTHEFDSIGLHEVWKKTTKTKDLVENGRRLENIVWRKFFQNHFQLDTINPKSLNWERSNCWLYGPLFENDIDNGDTVSHPKKRASLGLKRVDKFIKLNGLR